jgi:DNA-binding transcriptional LysR family regulator
MASRSSNVEGTLPNLLAFCRTFELGSFTLAAKSLRLTPAAVSRSVARLEELLGATLFRRTTRQLHPTQKGQAYYAKCSEGLRLLAEGEQSVLDDKQGKLRGHVRISVPTTYGLGQLLPNMQGFRKAFPDIKLEVHVSSHNIDFARDGFDLAIRAGAITDASLVARKLGDFEAGVFASPRYLKDAGVPTSVDDLARHCCISFILPRTGKAVPWTFSAPHQEWPPPLTLSCADDPMACVALAKADQGVIQTYRMMVRQEIERGELIEVLRSRGGCCRKFSLVYPQASKRSRAVKAVTDFIVTRSVGSTR